MQNDLISRSVLIEAMHSVTSDTTCPMHIAAEIDQIIDHAPAVDAVEVVRCKDCEHIKDGRFDIFGLAYCDRWKTDMQMDNYCCFGNRRDDDGRRADRILDKAPTIDPESLRPKGRWKFLDIDGWWFDECSICGYTTPNCDGSPPGWNYCPNCGADMRGEEDGTP